MPTFAELKAKAAGVTSSGVEKLQNVKDRHTSVPMAQTNWDPYSGQPPPPPPPPRSLVNKNTKPLAPLPPPPSRTSSVGTPSLSRAASTTPAAPPLPARVSSSAPPPPPPRGQLSAPPPPPPRSSPRITPGPLITGAPPPFLSTRPDASIHPSKPGIATTAEPEIDWSNLSPKDKEVFFSWLDEFFANFSPSTAVKTTDSGSRGLAPIPSHGPPPLRMSSKPISTGTRSRPQQLAGNLNSFSLSHPPPTQHGSAALDLAHYFAPSTPWNGAWYNSTSGPSIPPPIVGETTHAYTCSWRTRGSSKTTHVGIYFADLSVFWGTVEFMTTNPEDPRTVKRSAVYLPRPGALGREELLEAHETYGDTIALFAESFLGTGQCCGHGECWDLANEGLKYFADYDYIPKPVPSISRTHGHLIYEGKADGAGRETMGRWRGGDDRVRRGDIVEWRRVKIGVKGAPRGSFYTLGDPDHTAVVVDDSVPSTSPRDGGSLKPSELGVITVIEQSQGQVPEKRSYDLSLLEQGEVWIYRPISMKSYLGVSGIFAEAPGDVQGLKQL